ncbi:MAG: hypothetical protein QOE76_658 [Frankiales bacterium]|jgi:Flp pilus assembly pilin Flp|nr:hypothetical protein [Frankiales bacterium]MDX6242935.1 hypothetical protein [Frankiales bacterium]
MISKLNDRAIALHIAVVAYCASRAERLGEDRDAGVVSIEYLVLGAAIIFIIGIMSTDTTVQNTVKGAFDGLFQKATPK